MTQITQARIYALNEHADVQITFEGRHCIIVGPNGTGKSTSLQILAYALGRQWKLLSGQRFERIEIEFPTQVAKLSREECSDFVGSRRRRGIPRSIIERLEVRGLLSEFVNADLSISSQARKFSFLMPNEYDLRQMQSLLRDTDGQDAGVVSGVMAFEKVLDAVSAPSVFFLPTSRRIEFDLSRLTERLPEYARAQFNEVLNNPQAGKYYEEIVRFGMEDIEGVLRRFEQETREFSRAEFNRMMSTLLKDMVNNEHVPVKSFREYKVDSKVVQNVLARIEENVISQKEKDDISGILESLNRPRAGTPPYREKWLAHFFIRLLGVNESITEYEKPMLQFVSSVEKYLRPKKAIYDTDIYRFKVLSEEGVEIPLSELSSGEKQLVSVFALLSFAKKESIVMIDEPELSLSASWQTTFLPDIVSHWSCSQLIAVTHSPFIFDNELSELVVDFEACLER